MNEYIIEKNIEIPIIKRLIDDGVKKCCICKEVKNVGEFYLEKKRGYYSSRCKICSKKYVQEHRQTEHGKKLHREHQKRFIENNPEYDPKYRRSKKGKIIGRDSQRRWRKKNPEYNKKYNQTEKGKKTQQKSNAKRHSTPKGKINSAISCGIWASLKGGKNGKSWETLVGYKLSELMNHIESLFEDWMDWNNYGNKKGYWSLDHIKPISSFNFTSYDDKEFKECWALSNLRPLCAIENSKKGSKVDHE